jgi:hypothetical protein
MKTLSIILLLTIAASAEVPDAPSHTRTQLQKHENVYLSPFKDPFFYAGTLTATSGVLADVHFVQSCERDHTCFEANPGSDKYSRRLPEIGLVVLGSYGCSLMLHGHRWYRAICAVGPVALGLYHWHDTKITYLKDARLVRK